MARPSSTVRLELPADPSYLALARAAVAAQCAALDFPVDRLDDLVLAVDEAVALVLAAAPAGARVTVELTAPEPGGLLDLVVAAPTSAAAPPRTGTFAWTVLTALADTVAAELADGRLVLRLRAGRGQTGAP